MRKCGTDELSDFAISDPSRTYTADQVLALLNKAEALGLPMQKGSPLEEMTVHELEQMLSAFGSA